MLLMDLFFLPFFFVLLLSVKTCFYYFSSFQCCNSTFSAAKLPYKVSNTAGNRCKVTKIHFADCRSVTLSSLSGSSLSAGRGRMLLHFAENFCLHVSEMKPAVLLHEDKPLYQFISATRCCNMQQWSTRVVKYVP